MAKSKPKITSRARKPAKKNVHITKSGKQIKLNTSLADRIKASRDQKALRKAERLKGMPKSRVKRFFFRMHPKRLKDYWWSKEGGIMALKVTGIGLVVMFVLMVGVFAYFRKDLPNLRDISGNNIGGSIRYYDRTGKILLWEDYDAVKRIPVEGNQISEHLKHATIALEDREFEHHGGFDLKGITRAAWSNLTGGSTSQGGSTITQQLVKLSQDWSGDRSYTRKVKELILAVELERSYTKDEILTGYLNTAPYGNIQYGAQVAAQDYFRKDAKDLTLPEAVFLAAIPQAPSFYSPYGAYYNEENAAGTTGKQAVQYRMGYTLDVMAEMGYITKEERDAAKEVDVLAAVKKPDSKYGSIKAPYFALAAKKQLEAKYSAETVNRSGWKVTTTVDMNVQKIAEEEVSNGLAQVKRQGGDVAALTTMDVETGQIVAMVGGPDFDNATYGQNNYAQTPLPPGSSFKPYDYAALIDNSDNVGAGSVLYDSRGPLPGYPCTNKARPENGGNCLHDYDRTFPGPVTIRYALGSSRNVPAVKAMLITGVDKTIETADKIMNGDDESGYGYKCYKPETIDFIPDNEEQCYASAGIGDGAYLKMDEHVNGLATFARNGLNLPKSYILRIEDSNGKETYKWELPAGTQTVRPETAFIIADMLSDPNPSYFGRKIQDYNNGIGNWDFAVKTGTTNNQTDGWMTGFSTKYATAVWVGYHNRTVSMASPMENMTRPIWETFMQRAHKDLTPKPFTQPSGLQTLPAYVVRSRVGFGSVVPSRSTDIFPSWYQSSDKDKKNQIIDIISNKLATECTPELAKKTVTGGSLDKLNIDTFAGGGNTNTEDKDDVHKCSDVRPKISVTISGSDGNYTLRASVSPGTHPLDSSDFPGIVNFQVDGQTIPGGSVSIAKATSGVSYKPKSSGQVKITAQVIDSVKYDTTSNALTVTVSAASTNDISLSSSEQGGNIKFEWSGESGKVTLYEDGGGTVLGCTNENGSSCSVIKINLTNGGKYYVKDEDDNTSNIITVSWSP